MPELTDKHKTADAAKRELEDPTISPPHWALDHVHQTKSETDAKVIPKDFLDAIHGVIAKSIEQTLAEVMVRCVGESVERGIRPLAAEIALLRIAIEHEWSGDNQRRRRIPTEAEEPHEG